MNKASGFTCPSCRFDGDMDIIQFIEVDWLLLECGSCGDQFEYKVLLSTGSTSHEPRQDLPW